MLAKNRQQQKQFTELYKEYWKNVERAVDSKTKEAEEETQKPKPKESRPDQKPSIQTLKNWLQNQAQEEEMDMATYSAQEVMSRRDFSTFHAEELREVAQLIQMIAKTLANRYNRRYRKSKNSRYFDIKRTVRLNMRRGGEIVEIAFKKRRKRRFRLVMLCDVSKSMDLYSQFLIQFIYAFQQNYRRIETFVFSTALHRVTEQLREDSFQAALQKMAEAVPHWSGGTQIGSALRDFLEKHASRSLDQRTIVLILSDGWDTGDTELLAESMRQIQRKAAKVIWLNPLAGHPDFSPSVQGMQAALPYVDVFAPAHNVESLRAVLRELKA